MERRQFTREFKLEAVRLVKDRGVSYVQASQDLCQAIITLLTRSPSKDATDWRFVRFMLC